MRLIGRRMLVVGASAGIGRALAVRAVEEGAHVLAAARRGAELEKIEGCVPVTADVCAEDDCARLAETARDALGEIDVLVSCVGTAPLRMIADTDAADWRRVFDVNVVGFHQVLRACRPVLAPNAVVAVLSSESVDQPRSGLGAYSASKLALERTLTAWRVEHPGLRFCRIRVGATFPTGFGDAFDGPTLERVLKDWAARGLAQEHFMTPEEVAAVLTGVFATAADLPGVCLDELTVRSPSAVTEGFESAFGDHRP
ncbi:SDR family oxidoreductase [Actinomadura craniellae]|uniref:SDR family oxidoreductase n=1 Tax=Actinomadura craniellae TaxID=2231787 RepID=UPI0018F1E03B|nr:SDR family oxidoreductase [Actinomadura craniellae]